MKILKTVKYLLPVFFLSTAVLVARGGLSLARFRTKAAGSAQARVAGFSVEAADLVLTSADALLDSNVSGDKVTYRLALKNTSEVAVRYTLSAVNVPASVSCVFSPASGTLVPNTGTKEITVTFTLADPSHQTSALSLTNMKIQTLFEQVD